MGDWDNGEGDTCGEILVRWDLPKFRRMGESPHWVKPCKIFQKYQNDKQGHVAFLMTSCFNRVIEIMHYYE